MTNKSFLGEASFTKEGSVGSNPTPRTFQNFQGYFSCKEALIVLLPFLRHFTNFGSPGEIRTPVGGSKARYACPLHHRASA